MNKSVHLFDIASVLEFRIPIMLHDVLVSAMVVACFLVCVFVCFLVCVFRFFFVFFSFFFFSGFFFFFFNIIIMVLLVDVVFLSFRSY